MGHIHELLFAGTGAADFAPELETVYKDRLDRNCRRCSALLVDRNLLIDCGPHTLHALELLGMSLSGITDLFITHFHADHFDPPSVTRLAAAGAQPLRIHYREGADVPLPENAVPCPMRLMEPQQAGFFTVIGVPANHACFPQHLCLDDGEKRFFYGPDGAWLLNDTVNFLRNKKFDFMIFDATVGDYAGDYRMGEHNSIPMLRLMMPSLETIGAKAPDTRILLSHIAHTLHRPHEEICRTAEKEGWQVAYDGMKILL